jgi:hypothetical protein
MFPSLSILRSKCSRGISNAAAAIDAAGSKERRHKMSDQDIKDETGSEDPTVTSSVDDRRDDEDLVISVRPLQRAPRPRGVLAE